MSRTEASLILHLLILLLLAAAQDASKSDLAKLQGQWQMISSRRDGTDLPAENVKVGRRVCKDNSTTVTVGDMLILKADFKLDASKNPKTIDYDVTAGPFKGKKQLGIYKIEHAADGDVISFCFAPPDQARPDDFVSKSGDGRTLSSWKKAEPKAEEHGH